MTRPRYRPPALERRLATRRSPWLRVGLASAVVAMLPFTWSEDMSCDGAPKPLVSGLEILFGPRFINPTPGLAFVGLLAVAVGLGFAAARTSRPWWRLGGEAVASIAAGCTTMLCGMMMHHGRAAQPLDHPAAWVGTIASFAMMVEAWFASGAALRRGVEAVRASRGLAPPPATIAAKARIASWPTHDANPEEDALAEEESCAIGEPTRDRLRR